MQLLLSLINTVSIFGFLAVILFAFSAERAVKGTRRRYQAVSVIMTLAWPVMVSSLIMACHYAVGTEWASLVIKIVNTPLTYLEWRKYKNEDNWWNGRGKKWLKSLDNALGKLSLGGPRLAPQ